MKIGKVLLLWGALFGIGVQIGCASDSSNNSSNTSSDADSSEINTDANTDSDSDLGDDSGAAADSWVDIVDVATTGNESAYTFEVTFHSSDIDCTQFADWWEVLTEDGALLYRRILAHPHTEGKSGNPVMRSGGPVPVLSTDTVIVRGHMNNAGYIGTAMHGSVQDGFESAPDIGPDFAADVEDDNPQPDACVPE
jgi:hypothetical protein